MGFLIVEFKGEGVGCLGFDSYERSGDPRFRYLSLEDGVGIVTRPPDNGVPWSRAF